MTLARNYFAWQGKLVAREVGQRVVEVGCGLGNFTAMLLDRELVVAVDSDPACIERLKQRYPGRENLQAFTADAGGPAFSDLARFRPDSCVCLNVLEHIADDRSALEAMASILAPGGVIVLLLPAFQALYGPIDRHLGHYRRYDRHVFGRPPGRRTLDVDLGIAVRDWDHFKLLQTALVEQRGFPRLLLDLRERIA